MMQIVRHGHAGVRSPDPRPASPLGPRRRITTVTGQLLPTAAAPTSRLNVRSRLTTTIVVIRSRALTIHLQALIQRRGLIPHRAAAIQLRLAPTPHPAAAIAVAAVVAVEAVALAVEAEVAVAVVAAAEALTVVGAEALTAVEVPAHTVTVKSLC